MGPARMATADRLRTSAELPEQSEDLGAVLGAPHRRQVPGLGPVQVAADGVAARVVRRVGGGGERNGRRRGGSATGEAPGVLAVLIVLVGFSAGVETGLWAIAVYVIVQVVDGYLIVPYVARKTVDLAPALVLGAQLIFGALFGLLGLALADPIVAMIKAALEQKSEEDSAGDGEIAAAPDPEVPDAITAT